VPNAFATGCGHEIAGTLLKTCRASVKGCRELKGLSMRRAPLSIQQ
jgi:hypothetical protein